MDGCTGGVWGPGGYREGYTGYYPATLLEEGPDTAERAPEGLQGLEWVVSGAGRTGDGRYHPAGPVGPASRPSLYLPCKAASGPIRARFKVISSKVSQNGGVSPRNA